LYNNFRWAGYENEDCHHCRKSLGPEINCEIEMRKPLESDMDLEPYFFTADYGNVRKMEQKFLYAL